MVANGTAGQFDRALAVQQHQYHVPGYTGHGGLRGLRAQTVHRFGAVSQLPSSLARAVLAIFRPDQLPVVAVHRRHADQAVLHPQSGSTQQAHR